MDYINNKKYFMPPKNFWKIVGAVIMAIGVPFMFMGRGGSMISVVFIAIGACIFIFAKDARPSDKDIDEAVAKKIENLDEFARKGIDIRERLIKAFPPVSFSGFDFRGADGEEAPIVQRGSDRKLRSNKYSAAEILFAMEKLHIYMYSFCLTEENEVENYFEAKYTELDSASLERASATFTVARGKKSEQVTLEHQSIVVRDNNGSVVFNMPVDDGADVDKTVEIINRLITSKKEEATAAE